MVTDHAPTLQACGNTTQDPQNVAYVWMTSESNISQKLMQIISFPHFASITKYLSIGKETIILD